MKRTLLSILGLFLIIASAYSQEFKATITKDGDFVVVSVQPTNTITTGFSTSEFFVRLSSADADKVSSISSITNNTADFPDLADGGIAYIGEDQNGSETGFVHYYFAWQQFNAEIASTYNAGQSYEVFRFQFMGDESMTVDAQLVANDFFSPSYVTMFGSGTEQINQADSFFGDQTSSVSNSDGSTTQSEGVLNAALPITLSTFSARAINNKDAHLKWNTESEINGSHFELERSMDGVNFDKIATLAATGSADLGADYTYTDADVNDRTRDDVVRYYRLKMVDLDGEYKYSGIRNVNFTRELTDFNMEIYPNPTVDQVQIEMTGIDNTIVERPMLHIYDNTGALIQSRELDSDLGKIDMRDLPSKMYHFMITYKGQNYAQKIIKM